MKQNFSLILIVTCFFIACTKKEVPCSLDSFLITKDYDGLGRGDYESFVKINLCDSLLKSDTINMSFYGWTHSNISDHYISFNLPEKYTLKNIERISKFSVTIWNNGEYDLVQFLRLNDINYITKRNLPFYDHKSFKSKISKAHPLADDENFNKLKNDFDVFINSKNIIYYPWIRMNNTIKHRFKNIESEELVLSIQNKFNEEKPNNKDELDSWKSLARKYKKGDFLIDSEIFRIHLEEVLIKLKMQKNGNSCKNGVDTLYPMGRVTKNALFSTKKRKKRPQAECLRSKNVMF